MKLAIMQPYFLPYIGYWQLLNTVDQFIIYDNIEYTKKGWINRNRYLCNGEAKLFTIPLKKDSDFLDVREREISGEFKRGRLLSQIKAAYQNAPYLHEVLPVLESILMYDRFNLFQFILYSVVNVAAYLGIQTEIKISSSISIDHRLKGKEKVLELCRAQGADCYINPIGGTELYDKAGFLSRGIDLKFLKVVGDFRYPQFQNEFVPHLSILDVMMFNSKEEIHEMMHRFVLE